ncbi:MAG: hypothetical protein U5L08_14430 [Xanthomonadales bacterium]|nr:hypothetical protein [Xanthomonadales bacterium]
MIRWLRHGTAVVLTALVLGCTGGSYNIQGDPAEVERLSWGYSPRISAIMEDLYHEGELNAVLNFNRLGQAAFREGDLELAGRAFDEAIERIESVYADNAEARRARSKFTSEGTKDFKGEPYERSMAYFYRGLVDLALGDFDNARAMFLAGEFQDTLSEQEEYRGDFALLTWMAGWASHCGGQPGLARDYFDEANRAMRRRDHGSGSAAMSKRLQALLGRPSADDRTLAIAEWGRSPIKRAEGEHDEMLTFAQGGVTDGSIDVVPAASLEANVEVTSGMAELMYFQATTRGGRPIDGILEGQARFKSGAEAVGEVSTAVGSNLVTQGLLSGDSDMSTAGGAIALVGLFSSAIAASSKPQADTRRWAGLPGSVFAVASSADLDQPLDIVFQPSRGTSRKVATSLDRSAGGCRLVYGVRDGAGASADPASARHAIADDEFRKTMRRNAGRDGRFRQQLLSSLTHEDWVAPVAEPDPESRPESGSEPERRVVDVAEAVEVGPGDQEQVAVNARPASPVDQGRSVDDSPTRRDAAPAAAESESPAVPSHLETATGAFPRLDLNELWRDIDLSEPSDGEE